MTDAPPLHQALTPLAFLLGSWEGEGAGEYPTLASFRYRERVAFTHVGKPFLTGAVDATSLRLATATVATTPIAKRVDALERDFRLDGDVLSYAVRMAPVGLPLTHHLAARLRRTGAAQPTPAHPG